MNNLKCRKQGFNKYVCKRTNKEIKLSDCKNCPYKEYKDKKCTTIVKKSGLEWKNAQKSPVYCANSNKNSRKTAENSRKLQSSAKMNQKSSKLAKLERERFSLFTNDLEHCYFCGKKKDNIHEVIFGKNRINSIKFGLTLPLCLEHHRLMHKDTTLIKEYKQKGQVLFNKTYPNLNFEDIFKKNYL